MKTVWHDGFVLPVISVSLALAVLAGTGKTASGDEGEKSNSGFLPEVSFGAGYRNDQLSFTIAGIDGTPNILSELEWDSVESFVISGDLRWSANNNIYLRASGSFGAIFSGDTRDSDYDGDNRTMEWSRSYADTDDGSLFDGSVGVGYRFDIPLEEKGTYWRLIPMVGYAVHTQDFEMTNGYQAIYVDEDGVSHPPGPFDGLDSSYDNDWYGPWIGLELEWRPAERHSFIIGLEYSWLEYEAEANWNLREDLMNPLSFEHDADGDGVTLNVAYRYDITRDWFLGLQLYYYDMSTDSGTKTTYAADGTIVKSRFNGADWESFTAFIKAGYYF